MDLIFINTLRKILDFVKFSAEIAKISVTVFLHVDKNLHLSKYHLITTKSSKTARMPRFGFATVF